MVEHAKLSAVLGEFAGTMVTDFPIQRILDSLVERIVTILPISAAGVTLIAAGQPPRYIAASDQSALRFEQLQTEVGEGPCLLAFESGKAVASPDLRMETRFPAFCAGAMEAGLAGVFTFPLRHGPHGVLGALDIYRDIIGPLDQEDVEAAQTLADVAAAYLINAESREETQQLATRFHHASLHDALTGLPNRVLLAERLAHAAERARRSQSAAAILFVDLDRFKQVNDRHGHHVGDRLLGAVADRLSHMVRPGDTLSRVSGDEFVFLCEDLRSESDAEIIASRITETFAHPFTIGDLQLVMTASVGVAYAGPGSDISDKLVVAADAAMYQAKHRGGNSHRVIDLHEASRTSHRNRLETDLQNAVVDGTLAMAYQPVVRTSDGLVVGVEALLRWTHPEHGRVSPLIAIGIAEQSGLINHVGRWVLEQSGRDRSQWLQDFPDRPVDLSVNVSGRQLLSPGFCSIVENMLSSTGMDASAMILELTENVFIEDDGQAMTVLADLKALGVRMALDDFGTGFSSLSYLRRLPVDIVKIDRGFVSDIDEHRESEAIVRAVTDLTHGLGLMVIAEGVETRSQRDQIDRLGCELSQGYYFARPMTAPVFAEQLRRSTADPLRLPVQRSEPDSLSPVG